MGKRVKNIDSSLVGENFTHSVGSALTRESLSKPFLDSFKRQEYSEKEMQWSNLLRIFFEQIENLHRSI